MKYIYQTAVSWNTDITVYPGPPEQGGQGAGGVCPPPTPLKFSDNVPFDY